MARLVARALPLAARSALPPPHASALAAAFRRRPPWVPAIASPLSSSRVLTPIFFSNGPRRELFSWVWRPPASFGRFFATLRDRRRVRRRPAARRRRVPKEKQLELDVEICIEEELPEDPEILSIAETLRSDVPMAMKAAFGGLKDAEYKTRDTAIDDIDKFEKVELSVLLCNDDFICKLNKEWRDKDHATDVLSLSHHIPELDLPILMLGDIVISVETAARQAEERGHTLLDEIRILVVHGLLHLLGFDHEISDQAEAEMEKEEEQLLKSLGWKGKGLIKSSYDNVIDETCQAESLDEVAKNLKSEDGLGIRKSKLRYVFFDMDGTLLSSKSPIAMRAAEGLREAITRGANIVITTGKTRAAVMSALKMVDFAGIDGVVSKSSPGVFLQGSLVYGRQGQEIYRGNLDRNMCKEACLYSLEHEVPLVAFCQDRCLTLFEHPLVHALHTVYHEPKAEITPSVEQLLATSDIQKLMFLDTAEQVTSTLHPYWLEATKERASVVQTVPDMLEIIPLGTSKKMGVIMLLDHLGIATKEIMATGDGGNHAEMLNLASLGIALGNGSD